MKELREKLAACGLEHKLEKVREASRPKPWLAFLKAGGQNDYRFFVKEQLRQILSQDEKNMMNFKKFAWESPDEGMFASEYKTYGEKIVAVDMVYHFNDKRYGQWMAMHVPFRDWADLQDARVKELVPPRLQYIAHALLVCENAKRVPPGLHNFWRKPDKIKEEMKQEAHSETFTEDVISFVAGQIHLIDLFLSGQLKKEDEVEEEAQQAQIDGESRVYNAAQKFLSRNINRRLERTMEANHETTEAARDRGREAAWKQNSPIICKGRPGTGTAEGIIRIRVAPPIPEQQSCVIARFE